MKEWAEKKPLGYFVFTSNVDGHWAKCGVPEDHIMECHGSVHYLQCLSDCTQEIWPSAEFVEDVEVNENFRASRIPLCKNCKTEWARPNVLMFGDNGFICDREEAQSERFSAWLNTIRKGSGLVVLEIGAGRDVPTVRYQSQTICNTHEATLLRINPRDDDFPNLMQGGPHISIPMGGQRALEEIDKFLKA